MIKCLIVAFGGAIGAVLRYLIGLIPLSQKNGFPIKTFLINVIGCFIIGIIAALSEKNSLNPKIVLFIKVGFCSGFTTFSSFALETHELLEKGSFFIAILYIFLSILVGFFAVLCAEKLIFK